MLMRRKLVMMHMLKKRTMLMRMLTEQMGLTMHMQNTFITNNKTAHGVPYT
jgi:hypothetical protein